MQIGLLSDSHLFEETWKDDILLMLPSNKVDVMILLGDIASHWFVAEVCLFVQERLDCHVLFIPGNHDYYSSSENIMQMSSIDKAWVRQTKSNKMVHILINKNVVIDGVDFFGSTWWSSLGNDDQFDGFLESSKFMADFRYIVKSLKYEDHALEIEMHDPYDMRVLNKKSSNAFIRWHKKSNARKKVLCTHFPVSERLTNTNFKPSVYFNSPDDKIIEKHPIDCILFGHTHWNIIKVANGISYCSNMYGYTKEVGNIGFNKDFSIKV